MGVILFIMVTGTLPYLGEAQIKDPLYQYIKAKSPGEFWMTWKKLFKYQEADDDHHNGEPDNPFTSEDNDGMMNENIQADKSLLF